MRRYTIAKLLTLFLGVLSVVARSLPERRPEINVRFPGDVGNPGHPLEEFGLVKRHTTLGKRLDMSDHQCTISCGVNINEFYPVSGACASLYKGIQSMPGTLTLGPLGYWVDGQEGCAIYFTNDSFYEVHIDFLDIGRTAELLTSECIINRQLKTTALCTYEDVGADRDLNGAHPHITVAYQ